MAAHIKQMLDPALPVQLLLQIHRQRADHILGSADHNPCQAVLHRSQARKAVHKNHAVPEFSPPRQLTAQDIQNLLRRNAPGLDVLFKFPVKNLQIFKLRSQKPPVRGLPHLGQIIRPQAILIELRYLGLHLIDKPRLIQMPAVKSELSPSAARSLPQDHGFSRIVQNHRHLDSQILKYPIGQALKAQYVDIHNPMTGMKTYNFPLGLHSILLRHHKKIGKLRMLHGFLNCPLIQTAGLP